MFQVNLYLQQNLPQEVLGTHTLQLHASPQATCTKAMSICVNGNQLWLQAACIEWGPAAVLLIDIRQHCISMLLNRSSLRAVGSSLA